MRSWALRAAVVAFGMLGSESARAEGKERGLVSLEWTREPGAEACLSEPEIVEDVERALRRRVFAPGPVADRVLRASIAPAASGWHATIELSSKRGVALGAREIDLEGNDCREASSALVLTISLMVDLPELPIERAPPPPPSAPPPARRVEAPARVRAAIAPVAVIDDRPAVEPGGDVSLEIEPRAFIPVVVDLVLQLGTQGTARGQRYWLAGSTLAISLCPLHVARSRFAILACAGPEATLHAAWGRGFAENATSFSSTFGGLGQVRASYAFTDELRGFLLLGGIATPQRVDLLFGEAEGGGSVLRRTSHVMGLAGLGLTLEL